MHGIIFASLYDYARARLGPDAAAEIFAGRLYALADAYSDDDFVGLLHRTADRTELGLDELLRELGAFTGEITFPRLYPDYYTIAGGTRRFLLTVETRIHELVRATIPNATPPALAVRTAGEAALEIDYSSPRRLCRLLEGLVVGTARRYLEDVEIIESECMHEGAAACRFQVRVESARPS